MDNTEEPFIEVLFPISTTPGKVSPVSHEHFRDAGRYAVQCEASYGGVYQCFRIVQTGVNSSGKHNLFCSGVELYGTLHYG